MYKSGDVAVNNKLTSPKITRHPLPHQKNQMRCGSQEVDQSKNYETSTRTLVLALAWLFVSNPLILYKINQVMWQSSWSVQKPPTPALYKKISHSCPTKKSGNMAVKFLTSLKNISHPLMSHEKIMLCNSHIKRSWLAQNHKQRTQCCDVAVKLTSLKIIIHPLVPTKTITKYGSQVLE